MEDNELFGERHEQEENGLFGRKHAELCDLHNVIVPKGTLVCEHPLDKRASVKSHGKDFCWKCGEHITN